MRYSRKRGVNRKMYKKGIAMLIAAAVTLPLCGCDTAREAAADTSITTLTMLKPKGMKGFSEISDKYERTHANVQLKLIDVTDSTNEVYKIYEASLTGRDSDIDLLVIDEIWTQELVHSGYLEPLNFETDKYEPLSEKFFTSGGKMYALPFALDIGAVFYRKDRVQKAPQSMEDIFNEGVFPVFEKKQDEDLLCAAIELGKDLERAYPYFADSIGENSGDLRTKFKNGEINYYRGWSKDYAYFNDYDFEIGGNVGVMIPKTPVAGGYGIAVSSFSRNKQTAFEFLEYLSDPSDIREILKRAGYIPTQKEYLTDEMFADYNPCMYKIEETLGKAATRISDREYVKKAWELQEELYKSISENTAAPKLDDIYEVK